MIIFIFKVAYSTIYRDLNGTYPSKISNLDDLIKMFVPESEKNVYNSNQRDFDWSIRPLPNKLKYIAIRETTYLLDLYQKLNSKLLERFNKGCTLYLNVVKNCENEEKSKIIDDKVRSFI